MTPCMTSGNLSTVNQKTALSPSIQKVLFNSQEDENNGQLNQALVSIDPVESEEEDRGGDAN